MVINESILGALNSALARGESLKKAMMTLYNSGYKKEEISEAARSAQASPPATLPQTTPAIPAKKSKRGLFKKSTKQPTQLLPQKQTLQPAQPTQSSEELSLAPSKELTPKAEQSLQPIPTQQTQPQVSPQQVPTQSQVPQQPVPQVPLQQGQVPPQQPASSQTPQRVSSYGQPPKPAGKMIIIILGFLLLLLVGILVTIFLFKEELINFFNNLFN